MTRCDLLIIGGGINGAGIARDAAGRGLKVVLCDRGDLGGATSSASSKLVHGGLRYLEYGAFGLVAEALGERERLLKAAPHLVRPAQFLVPWRPGRRPAWMIQLGLLLYDWLGGSNSLGRSRSLRLDGAPMARGLDPSFRKGFLYPDCQVDDARLVIVTLRAAAALGATILPRTACIAARREASAWQVLLADGNGAQSEISARVVVNAAGPWAELVARDVLGLAPRYGLRLVKGSHIVVPQLYPGDHGLVLQAEDGRVVFVLPFEEEFSLIGTTEVPLRSPDLEVVATDEEIEYLCRAASRALDGTVTPDKVLWSFAGMRALVDDHRRAASALSREYKLMLDETGDAPVLTVYGGKLTTYRRLAEKVLTKLAPSFPRMGGPWTDAAPLPGGKIPKGDFALYLEGLGRDWPWLPRPHLEALARRHGSLLGAVLDGAAGLADLGHHFGAGLYERELAWFRDHEWAVSGDDVLWRRTKAGLRLGDEARAEVARWMASET